MGKANKFVGGGRSGNLGSAPKVTRQQYKPDARAASGLSVKKVGNSSPVDPGGTQSNTGRFTSTARSRGGNLYANQPQGNSRIYQKSDTGAISAFKTPSGNNNVASRGKADRPVVNKNDGGSYNSPMIENGMNPKTGKAAEPSKTNKPIQKLMNSFRKSKY